MFWVQESVCVRALSSSPPPHTHTEEARARRHARAAAAQAAGKSIGRHTFVMSGQATYALTTRLPGAMTVSPPAAAAIESESLPPSHARPSSSIASLCVVVCVVVCGCETVWCVCVV